MTDWSRSPSRARDTRSAALAELYEPATTDEERAAWDVPPLAEQLRRADELTRSEPQPPMDGAPGWLRAAIERWATEGGKEP